MKKFFIYFAIFFFAVLFTSLLMSGTDSVKTRKSVILQFITYNGFGNNLYVDNVITGNRRNYDIAITSLNNISKDTTFLPDLSFKTLSPSITVTNIGMTASTSNFGIFISIPELSYSDSDSITNLNSGQSHTFTFDSVTIPAGQIFSIFAYLDNPLDSNKSNDTIIQKSIFLTGATSKVLIEEFLSSTSPSCGMNNIYLDTFITHNFANICPVKYHVGFPPPGIDSMYIQDSVYVNSRRYYYFANTVPLTIMNGTKRINVPYYVDTNLYQPYREVLEEGSVVSVNVVNSQPSPDTIVSTVTLNFLYRSHSQKLKLRAAAVERFVAFSQPIGASGERYFYDVYRKSLTDTSGILISGDPGTQEFVFRFYKNPLWSDTMMYTVAFIQDDNNRHILNCGRSAMDSAKTKLNAPFRRNNLSKPDFDASIKNSLCFQLKYSPDVIDTVSYLNFENFEGPFPPQGWTITNPDGYFSFEKALSINGITLGGNNSVIMPFYYYNNIGQRDTLISVSLDSVSSFDTLSFDYAYAQYLTGFIDSLIVNISVDGGQTFTNIFRKGGFELATAQATTLPFIPYSTTQWKTFRYPMSLVIPDYPNSFIPVTYELYQNYPNPFNPTTKIAFDLPRDAKVKLVIYDILGREVKTLLNNEYRSAGKYISEFNGSQLASGVYFARILVNDGKEFIAVKKMVLVK